MQQSKPVPQSHGSTDAEYRLAYIFIEVDDPASEASVDQARETAQTLRQQIANGRDFREVAVAESDASNALEGGDMGWRSESQLPSLVAPVVPDLEVGEPSQVLENNSGFHLVMVMDKRGGEQQQFIQQHRVRHILVRPSEAVTDVQAEQRIREIYQQLQDGADFADLARERSDLFTYVPTVSRPHEARNNGWPGQTGRVNEIVERYVEKFELTPEGTIVYACGHPDMIQGVKERFCPLGYRVEVEGYW